MPIDHVHALPPGTRFEEYRLDAVLGAGGFGITYRAYDANLEKFVAIKEYLPGEFAARTEASTVVPHSSADAQDYQWGLNRFLDEARTLARFDHPNLNKVYRFFEAKGTAYMVLEYIEGETLAGRLQREPRLPEDVLRRLLEEVLSGLEVVHEAGYVHRDIKPGNLMLRAEDGSAVLLDFGAARQAVGRRSQRLTTILTPGYAPIEQYDSKAEDVGPWSDVYALGMVAYRCISGAGDGELPDAVTRAREQRKGGTGLEPAVEVGKGGYSPKLLAAIDWAIEVDEESRPQGVGAWREALAGSASRKRTTKPVRKKAAKTTKAPATERTGMSWSGIALTLVIVALLGASAWQGWRLYRAMPDVSGEAAVTPAESQAGAPAELQTTAEPGEQVEETPTGAEPDETLPPAQQDEVTRLLAGAAADIEARRLTSPVGNNAWEKYQRVLGLSPANPEAVAGMERVIESYMDLFATALEGEDFDKAEGYMERIRVLHPDSPVLEEGARRIEDARQARTKRLARNQAVRQHLDSFETALQQDNLDEATASLERVRALSPTTSGLSEAEQRLAEAETERQAEQEQERQAQADRYEASFEQALRDGNVDKAESLLSRLRSFRPGSPWLTAAQRHLDEARRVEAVGEMVSIPGGRVPAFRLGKYEVTFGQWDACVADGGCMHRPQAQVQGGSRSKHPVINVSWDDAQSFIGWLNGKTSGNYRLPSDAELEYAVRVGGVHGMHNSVKEWSRDCWNESYAGAPSDNCARRGGLWGFDAGGAVRSVDRLGITRTTRHSGIGFRLAQDN